MFCKKNIQLKTGWMLGPTLLTCLISFALLGPTTFGVFSCPEGAGWSAAAIQFSLIDLTFHDDFVGSVWIVFQHLKLKPDLCSLNGIYVFSVSWFSDFNSGSLAVYRDVTNRAWLMPKRRGSQNLPPPPQRKKAHRFPAKVTQISRLFKGV